jgi:penicillin-binding protein 1A
MATAYATLANRGIRVDPVFVTKVTKADGTVLYEHHRTAQRVIPRDVADTVTSVLEQVVQRGTGVRANIGRPVAGKTGTGQEWRDAWFVGYTPDLATAVWVGFPQAQISMVPPRTRIKVVGGTWPAQIWQLYMSSALAEVPASAFAPPPPPPEATTSTTVAPVARGTVTVPNVVGLTYRDAATRLRAAGLVAVEHDVPNGDYPPGYVVAQQPRPSGLAPPGSDVVLDVSTGASQITTVPDVLGLTEAQARSAIARAGLKADVTVQAESEPRAANARKGRVWGQNPAGGERRQVGDTVQIWVNPS